MLGYGEPSREGCTVNTEKKWSFKMLVLLCRNEVNKINMIHYINAKNNLTKKITFGCLLQCFNGYVERMAKCKPIVPFLDLVKLFI